SSVATDWTHLHVSWYGGPDPTGHEDVLVAFYFTGAIVRNAAYGHFEFRHFRSVHNRRFALGRYRGGCRVRRQRTVFCDPDRFLECFAPRPGALRGFLQNDRTGRLRFIKHLEHPDNFTSLAPKFSSCLATRTRLCHYCHRVG